MWCEQHRTGTAPHDCSVLHGAPSGAELLLSLANLRVRETVFLPVRRGGACGGVVAGVGHVGTGVEHGVWMERGGRGGARREGWGGGLCGV